MIGLFKGLALTLRTYLTPAVTVQYPEERLPIPERQGFPNLKIDPESIDPQTKEFRYNCNACGLCAKNCPNQVITVTRKEIEGRKQPDVYEIDVGGCMFCGICIEVCPFDGLLGSPLYEMAYTDKKPLIYDKDMLTYRLAHPVLWGEKERKWQRKIKELRY